MLSTSPLLRALPLRTALITIFLGAMGMAQAGTIISNAGPIQGSLAVNEVAASWTQADTWTNVSITLGLYNSGPNFDTDKIYLTNSLGPGTTAANEVAVTTFGTAVLGNLTVPAFSGLTLGPGTYYLILERTSNELFFDGVRWGISTMATTTGPGVVDNGLLNAIGQSSGYAPANNYTVAPYAPVFSVTGDQQIATPTPEPSTTALTGMVLFAASILLMRRETLAGAGAALRRRF